MLVFLAKLYATLAHRACGHRRKYTHEPYIVHPEEVARIVSAYTNDPHIIAAAWLHDVVEDCGLWGRILIFLFPARTVELVLEVTKVSTKAMGKREFRVAIDRQHYAMASSGGQLIKLADTKTNTKRLAMDDPQFAPLYISEKAALLPFLSRANRGLWLRVAKQLMRASRDLGMDTSQWHPDIRMAGAE